MNKVIMIRKAMFLYLFRRYYIYILVLLSFGNAIKMLFNIYIDTEKSI